jgi:hypothetical protein
LANKKSKATTKQHHPILSSNEKELLYFLWRYRISTFPALRFLFFQKTSKAHAYHRLNRLRLGQYIETDRMLGSGEMVWCLGKKGFQFLQATVLPEVKKRSYRPQSQRHDLLVAAALLGDWAVHRPPTVGICSEQELTTLDKDFLPKELKFPLEHAPDGFWHFNQGKESRFVALEVETSAKSSARYEQICATYAGEPLFVDIVWIVADRSLGKRILDVSRKHGDQGVGNHLFIELRQFELNGWQAPFLNESKRSYSLGGFLRELAGDPTWQNFKSPLNETYKSPNTDLEIEMLNPFLRFEISSPRSTGCTRPADPEPS